MEIKNVMIAGGGTLGSQIAWQVAFHGFDVVVYDAFEKGIAASKEFHKQFAILFETERGASKVSVNAALNRINYTCDMATAVSNVDLVNESIPENIELKKEFYRTLGKVAPERTIFTTNTSTTLPSDYAEETGRPEKFLALHFANGIWDANIGEVMGHETTDKEVFNLVVEFAKNIGMVPIPIYKEQNGYVINSLLGPLLSSATDLLANGVADTESIDKTWMIAWNTKFGPFGVLDIIGLQTAYNIESLWAEKENDSEGKKRANFIKTNYLDKGKFGVNSGEGFYTYPHPTFYNSPEIPL